MKSFIQWLEHSDGVRRAYFNSGLEVGSNITGPNPESILNQHRDLAEELVYAYKDAKDDRERQDILYHIKKIPGMIQVGKIGEIIPYSGLEMELDSGSDIMAGKHVFSTDQGRWQDDGSGDPVKVIRPGFRITNIKGNYLITKTIVSSVHKGTPKTSSKITQIPLGSKEESPILIPKSIKPDESLKEKLRDLQADFMIAFGKRKTALAQEIQNLKQQLGEN
jgi:hypothetical protein